MAKKLKKFEFPEASSAIKSIYDWDGLLNGEIWQLEAGKDYQCKPVTFFTLARAQAKKRTRTLQITKQEDGTIIMKAGPEGSYVKKEGEDEAGEE